MKMYKLAQFSNTPAGKVRVKVKFVEGGQGFEVTVIEHGEGTTCGPQDDALTDKIISIMGGSEEKYGKTPEYFQEKEKEKAKSAQPEDLIQPMFDDEDEDGESFTEDKRMDLGYGV